MGVQVMPKAGPNEAVLGGFDLLELSELYSMSVSHWRAEIRSGRLKAKKVGTRVIVLAKDLIEYFDNNPDWTPGEAPTAAVEARRKAK